MTYREKNRILDLEHRLNELEARFDTLLDVVAKLIVEVEDHERYL